MRGLCQDRQVGDTQEGSSYHGNGIDVLLTEQRLKKQNCTLGKSWKQGDKGSVCLCWVRRMNIWRHEMRREDEGIHTLRSMKAGVTGLRLKISGQALIKNIGRSSSGVRSNTQNIGNLEESNRRCCTALYLNSWPYEPNSHRCLRVTLDLLAGSAEQCTEGEHRWASSCRFGLLSFSFGSSPAHRQAEHQHKRGEENLSHGTSAAPRRTKSHCCRLEIKWVEKRGSENRYARVTAAAWSRLSSSAIQNRLDKDLKMASVERRHWIQRNALEKKTRAGLKKTNKKGTETESKVRSDRQTNTTELKTPVTQSEYEI